RAGFRPPIAIERWLSETAPDDSGESAGPILAAAFLVALAGPSHPLEATAREVLDRPAGGPMPALARLFRAGAPAIQTEVGGRRAADPWFAATLDRAASGLADPGLDGRDAREAIWSVVFPEGTSLLLDPPAAIEDLRVHRIVDIDVPNPAPVTDAARQILFSSNVLLGLPLDEPDQPGVTLDPLVAAAVERASRAPQRYWFDHPIPIGVAPAASELLHGLRGLDQAMRAEPTPAGSGGPASPRRITCLLSVSVTHHELRDIARHYVEGELARIDRLDHVDVLVASETDVRRLVDDVLLPALARFGPAAGGSVPIDFDVLGVDGEYGRHYSFLKAMAAIWQVVIDPGLKGTFKIDLDQVFPQPALLAETGRTALQHFETPLWGALGRDSHGRPVELGLIAGALVNAADIGAGLFSPDIPIPAAPSRASEHVFFSALPQAISTEAEMMERYATARPDGRTTALERVHVTGGTNGILVDALRRHRPFTPSFIGRAEDQAYILSVQGDPGPRLAYVHAAGLIMRHDKEAYAGAAVDAGLVGKLVGDDVRILGFSAYAGAVADRHPGDEVSVDTIKALLDPFTGSFISDLPSTVVLLRFALRILELYGTGQAELGHSYADIGSRRLAEAFEWAGDGSGLRATLDAERAQWRALYDTLDGLEGALAGGDPEAVALQERARVLIDGWRAGPRAD
ncbi:MAG: hypothetical protein ACHQXL_07445, partial [Candidatus Limnocylindrales bacterium]